ncbi:oligosacharyl transferase STT3 subunit [Plasmodium falciparum IGH-CR14]|uniref:dolichyl-diphosphooligosaccharide--protein glycotransferase n=2 Tax=Plasmodium falciparum TaxID=5833 RepID=A0A0L0CUJ6_PLAFA|nr:oligosacharyl transferase STT3 subunit [Plasmodium falciparum RAJ116]KNG77804.1 oligosacharyl transferase STT3 subunit [Plasmodium falciparum IGH-CR14]
MVKDENMRDELEEEIDNLRARFFVNRLFERVFCSHYLRKVMIRSKWMRYRMEVFILLLIGVLSFIIRLFSVIRNEAIIHEYDPYFNYKLTNILKEEDFYKFWNYFDEKSWYPLGRTTGQTLFPGLMITSFLFYKICHFFGILVSMRNICIYIGPIFSFFTCIISYFLTREIYNFSGAALLSALFVSISPSHISRTVAGSYDNESISIFLLLLCIYNWIRCLKKGSLLSVLICSLSTYYMALSWGAYIFITNSISLFMLIIIILKKYTIKHFIIYNVYYILTTILCLNIPCIHRSVFINKLSWNHRSRTLLDPTYASKHNPIVASISEHQPTTWSSYFFDIHLILLFFPLGLYECFKKNGSIESFFLGIFTVLCLYFSSLMVRLLLIFSPFSCILSSIGLSSLISRFVPIIRISPDTYLSSIILLHNVKRKNNKNNDNDNDNNDNDNNDNDNNDNDNNDNNNNDNNNDNYNNDNNNDSYNNNNNYNDSFTYPNIPSNGNVLDKDENVSSLNSMRRHENILEEFNTIKNDIKYMGEYKKGIKCNNNTNIYVKKLNFNKLERRNNISILTSVSIVLMLLYYVILIILHSTWCSSIAYSESNITFYSRNKNGDRYINDDIRQMYKWINENTEINSKIVAWWDYGYQLSVMSNRITYIDNNTWNPEQIATIGLILSTNEKEAYEYLKMLDCDYILVSYGGYSKNSSDDLNKFLWILKITNKKYKFINPLFYYYHDKYHPLGKNATTFMTNSVLYKLSYYNLTNNNIKGYDYIRKIQVPEIKNLYYFEEVFTSDVWGFRLYKIKDIY